MLAVMAKRGAPLWRQLDAEAAAALSAAAPVAA
jgi:hypothetical protein